MKGKFVAYYRVSKFGQGRSDLGLEAQRNTVRDHLGKTDWMLVAEYTEVEGGSDEDRPALAAALADCRLHTAILVIAEIGWLARNVSFLSALLDSDVEFVTCDLREANRHTVHILAALAKHQCAMISRRTRDALAAAKARGVRLGNPDNLDNRARAKGTAVSASLRRAKADRRTEVLWPTLYKLKQRGLGLTGMAGELNALGILPPRGGRWSATQVARVVNRARPPKRHRAISLG